MDRRSFLQRGVLATAAATTMGSAFWRRAFAAPAEPGEGPYGPLLAPDANGIMLPQGFTSRVIARAGLPVIGSAAALPYVWHVFPDGGATFATEDGWIYVSNSEVPGVALGGCGAIRFAADGSIVSAYRILDGTRNNCAGGPTPWGTWLSCEETGTGFVYECDPLGVVPAIQRPALGSFSHEAAAIDPVLGQVYLTEDQGTGLFYRFTPANYPSASPDLTAGTLEAMTVHEDNSVAWELIPHPVPGPSDPPTRSQTLEATLFDGGEGCWFDAPSRTVYFTTKGNNKVWALDVDAQTLDVVHDPALGGGILSGVDNVTVSRSGDLFIAEDGGSLDIVLITPDRVMAKMLTVSGQIHSGSEITGPAFDPSGSRLYFSSQRGAGIGITYEVSGPFRQTT